MDSKVQAVDHHPGRFRSPRLALTLAVLLAIAVVASSFLAGIATTYKFPRLADRLYTSATHVVHLGEGPVKSTQAKLAPGDVAAESRDDFSVSGAGSLLEGTVLIALRGTNSDYPQRIVEVNGAGEVAWEYRPQSVPGAQITDIRKLANGNVLFVQSDPLASDIAPTSSAPDGWVVEVNRDKQVILRLHTNVTHHAEFLPSGDLLLVDSHKALVSEVKIDGGLVWQWSARDHIKPYDASDYVGYTANLALRNTNTFAIEYPSLANGTDWLHINSAQRLANGDTLISLRNLDLVAEVNMNGDVVRTIGALQLKHQHCAWQLPNGNYLISDDGNARVVEMDPATQQVVWSYDRDLLFPVQGCAYRLPNGDTLITDSAHLRVLEVNPAKQTVWQLKVNTPATVALYRAWWSAAN